MAVGILLTLLVVTGPVLAQGSAQVQLETRARRVGVDEPFRVTVVATGGPQDPSPGAPSLTPPSGITALGSPSIGTQHQMSFSAGRTVVRQGIRATWVLRATRTGRFTIGPASVSFGAQRVRSNTITIEVVAAGQHQPPPRNPWGLFGPPGWPTPFGPGPDPMLGSDPLDPDLLPSYPRELATDEARDELAFLTATTSPRRVVIGEPTTLRIVAYGRGGRFNEGKSTEPVTSSFVSYPVQDTSYAQQQYRVPIGEEIWWAMKVREIVLYPVETGNLEIGPMQMQFVTPHRGGYMGRLVQRSSPPVEVVVTEPPAAGRPSGYVLGDVGRFTLKAEVQPREVSAGEAISVVVKVEGEGNFPSRLPTPQQKGVEWLEPTISEQIDLEGGKLRGFKRFSYVVRLQQPGTIDLGELELPHWDPVRRAYASARAKLGVVVVQAAGERGAAPPEPSDRLAAVVAPRATLGAPARSPLRWADRPWFWLLLAAGPLGVVAGAGVVRVGGKLSARWRSQRASLATQCSRALLDAKQASLAGDAAATASAGERALFLALEQATGIRARGVLRGELRERLTASGAAERLTDEICELLDRFDEVRFTGASDLAPRQLFDQVRHGVQQVRQSARGRRAK